MDSAPFTELLSAIVDNRGRTAPTAHTGIPLIATNCIKDDRLYPVFENVRHVDDEAYRTWFRGHPHSGDILFVCKGSPGRVALVPDPVSFCIAQDMVAVRADQEKVDPRFLFASLRSAGVRSQIANMHVGTLIPHFKKGDFDKLRIPLPPRNTQAAIGDLYFDMSEKIESNRTRARLSEELAQSLFRSWFIEKLPWGGETPADWHEGQLSDLLRVVKQSTKAGDRPELPYVPIDMLPMHSLGLEGARPNRDAQSSLTLFERNDILIGAMRVYFHRVCIAPFDGITRSTTFVLRPLDKRYLSFALLLCNQEETISYADATSQGSTMPYAVWDGGLGGMPVSIPSTKVAAEFSEMVWPLIQEARDLLFENEHLSEMRDWLLDEMITGRISHRSMEPQR